MPAKKNYAVVVFENAAEELAPFTVPWLKRENGMSYFYAREINPNGVYFHMTLEHNAPTGAPVDFELQIPHSFVKAVLYAADYKSLGFKTAP